ncbi:hypothetical protein [Arcobacter porcinus]|uniref:Uncharacterized protein n=1 Tax=Arcobacter porcinus TaxID=1935204 RepID=A0A1C0AY93_9BACT|nr:hypothetical protein [Arcobacter porcinus]OCL90231.1 hypothetical protein AAX27_01636 [Aliarcobacter thereius]OCL83170.1 hypothetical protein AAW30_01247 [Arcobacter porcinus]OCL83338.1 hypothetical protein AAW29_00929 [Arcobacter porcinus]OCL88113.1 hypothetical protein AAX30_00720 [Arcobacter porcinus]OCL92604.1 hypothetical protein AAX28_00139 [Arcobacter porcinus]
MKDRLKEAFKLRFEYYNLYNNKEEKWHKKYKNHELYELVKYSFNYDFKDIGEMMPKLLKEFEKRL